MAIVADLAGIIGGGGLLTTLGWMIGLQLTASLVFVLAAVACLPACVKASRRGRGSVASTVGAPTDSPPVQAGCWRRSDGLEGTSDLRGGLWTDLFNLLVSVMVLGGMGYGASFVVPPALAEVQAYGYGSLDHDSGGFN